jgi:hypothetical protein
MCRFTKWSLPQVLQFTFSRDPLNFTKQETSRSRRQAHRGLLLDPEDGGSKFFRNVGALSELHSVTNQKIVLLLR